MYIYPSQSTWDTSITQLLLSSDVMQRMVVVVLVVVLEYHNWKTGGCVCADGVMGVYMHLLAGQKFLDILVVLLHLEWTPEPVSSCKRAHTKPGIHHELNLFQVKPTNF